MQKYNFVFIDDMVHNYLVYGDKHKEIIFVVLLYPSVQALVKIQ